jgi:Seed dormancy control
MPDHDRATASGPTVPTTPPTQTPTQTQTRNGFNRSDDRSLSQREQFTKFFESFLSQQSQDLSALRDAASDPPDESYLSQLISRVVSHYEHYYEAKEASARRDVSPMFSPSWTSTTENIFMWIGGWRPSAAFHLLYSKSGMQLEARMEEIIRGGVVQNLGNMSAAQLQAVDRFVFNLSIFFTIYEFLKFASLI